MANVKFLRGSQTQLPTSGTNAVEDGALYFAINQQDSGEERGKLYLGDENHKLIPIGEDIVLKVVETTSQLPLASKHGNEFYYCTTGNILAFSDGSTWHQVNTNTMLDDSINLVSTSFGTNTATVALRVSDNAPGDPNEVTGNIVLKGGDNVTVEANAANSSDIKISAVDTTYAVGLTTSTKSATIGDSQVALPVADVNLTSTKANDNSSFKIYSPNDSITVGVSDGAVTLAVNGARLSGINGFVGATGQVNDDGSVKSGAAATQGFHHNITLGTGDIVAANIDPQISYRTNLLSEATATYSTPVHFENGVAQLPVYSASAVEARITKLENTINAMQYRGSLADKQALDALATNSQLHNGDVFVAANDFGSSNKVDGQEVKEGYLIIVQGQENESGVITGTPSYTVVKANDTDTTYDVNGITNGIQIRESQGSNTPASIGSIEIAAGSGMTVTDSGTNSKVVTVTHTNVSHTTEDGTPQAMTIGQDISFTGIVTGIQTDDRGHITKIITSTLSAPLNDIDTDSYVITAGASNNVSIAHQIAMTSGNATEDSFTLGSSGNTIAVTSSGKNVNLDIVWGTFGSN